MGHEAAGIVKRIGRNVRQFTEGDRVTFDSTVYCGQCFFCRRGEVNLCDNRQVLGVSCSEFRRDGAFAEYIAVPERICYKLPDNLPFEHAAMIEAVSVAVHAVGLTPVRLGDTAMVVGTGMIGLLVLQSLRLAGCGRLIAVDLSPERLELATALGADEAIIAQNVTLVEAIRLQTDGRGVDIAVEVVGGTEPLKTAIAGVRKGGIVTLVGNLAPNVDLPLQSVVTRQIRLIGSCASAGEYPACIDLLSRGAIRVDRLISAKAPLAEGPEWFWRLYHHEGNLMKVVLQP
jgi:L-iditol 2-dehydrogenase